MKKKAIHRTIVAALVSAFLMTMLGGCGGKNAPAETAAPAPTAAPVSPAEPAGSPEAGAETGRRDGERFEAVIILEGMEETVRYEHIRNDTIGVEMDYDYESFVRQSEPDRERFLSIWDDPENPENYLEVAYSPEDADTAAASVSEALSGEYDPLRESRQLDRAGSCVYIEASVIKNTNRMADQLQAVYIIPASDGCRVATAHFSVEAAEGFGRRFAYMMHTLAVIDRTEGTLSDEQALSAVRNYCLAGNPDLEGIVNAGEYPVYWEIASSDGQEIVVLFRSYTGAQLRYHIDRITGETYVTESAPGASSGETRTGESFNVRDYSSGYDGLSDKPLSVPGTWQTASVGYEADGTMFPEYYARFTDTEILYGHMKDGELVFDHADGIILLEETGAGGFKVQAEASNGVRYTYQTSESDENVLEYYETWDEAAFPEMYRGGASLSRCG